MEGSSVGVPSIQPPRCERRGAPGFLGCTAAVLAAVLCASVFVATARAEDPPTPASDGAVSSSDSIPAERASAASTDNTATVTNTTDSSGTTTDTSAIATDASCAATESTDGSGTTTDTCGTTTDTSATATDTTDSSATATDASCAAPSDTSGGSDAQASNSADGAASTSTPAAPSVDTRVLENSGASSSGDGSPADSPASSSPTPEGPSGSTTSDSQSDVTVVPTSGRAAETGAIVVIRCGVDRRVIVVCGLAPLTRAPSDSERVLLGPCNTQLEATQAGQPDARTGEGSGRPHAAPRLTSPRLPAPDNEPQVPTTLGSSLGSGSAGGFHGGAVLGVLAAGLSLIPLGGERLVKLVELRRRALPVAFLLDRPG